MTCDVKSGQLMVLLTLFAVGLAAKLSSSSAVDVVESRTMPVFRPLRRVVRNFVNERQAFITIVFQRQRRNLMPTMRWFRQVEPKTLPHAEIPDMINIDGDSRYRVRLTSSNDVTAVTLIIQPLDVTSFPVKFVTCFSYNDDPFQYQLDTNIDEPTERSSETLDGIVWLDAPLPHVSFSPELMVHCMVKLETESSRHTDELNVYRTFIDRKRYKNGTYSGPHLMSAACVKIYKDREPNAEDGGKYISLSKRTETVPGRRINVIYDVTFKVLNGSLEDIGVYTCAGERERDRTYISSWLIPPHSVQPIILFQPCEESAAMPSVNTHGSSQNQLFYQVRVVAGRPTCVRCRVYDRRLTKIQLSKNNEIIRRSDSALVLDDHLNVADGGLSELTLTFLNPSMDGNVSGRYRCAALGVPGVTVEFNVVVVRAPASRSGQ